MSDKTLSHKGYLGSIETSLDDNCLFGEVLYVNDLVTYEGKTVEELQKAFVDAVDHYLARCAEEGLAPDKPCSGTFNVRISPELHRAACVEATKKGVSLNDLVREAISQAVSEGRTVINETHHHTHFHTLEVSSEQGQYENVITTVWQTDSASNLRKSH